MVGVLVDHDPIASPVPARDNVVIVRGNVPVEVVKPEPFSISAPKHEDMLRSEATGEAPVDPGLSELVMRIVGAAVMSDPLIVLSVNVQFHQAEAAPPTVRPPSGQLQRDSDRKPDARMPAVVKVVPVVITDVNVIGSVPVLRPGFRPGIQEHERKASVREARISHVHRGAAAHPKPVLVPEREAEGGLRNEVTAIASTLSPSAVVGFPVLRTTLLPCTVFLPAALLYPSPLLLPRGGLLPRTLRLPLLQSRLGTLRLLLLGLWPRSLLGPPLLRLLLLLLSALSLLLLRPLRLRLLSPLLPWLLSGLCALRLRLLLLLLSALRLLLRLLLLRLLSPLLLRLLSGLCALRLRLLTLLLFRLALFFVLLVVLRVRRDNHPEKQKQGSGTGSSNDLHSNRAPSKTAIGYARR